MRTINYKGHTIEFTLTGWYTCKRFKADTFKGIKMLINKHLLLILLSLLSFAGEAQNVRKDANGNYIAISSKKATTLAKSTGKTFTDSKGQIFPVMESGTGKLYVLRTSAKTGKQYKQYLKP